MDRYRMVYKFTKQTSIVKQDGASSDLFNLSSTAGTSRIPNLTATIYALYSGTYKIEISVNFGSWYVSDNQMYEAAVTRREFSDLL
jgi:hypothetical protein